MYSVKRKVSECLSVKTIDKEAKYTCLKKLTTWLSQYFF